MSLPVAFRPARAAPWLRTAVDAERSAERRVGLAWAMLLLNTLTYYPKTWDGAPLVIHIPSAVGKSITQGALLVALALALSVNRRPLIRPNVFLACSLLVVDTLMSAGQATSSVPLPDLPDGRFPPSPHDLAALALVGRRGHRLRPSAPAGGAVLGSVLVGFMLSPHSAHAGSRLGRRLYPADAGRRVRGGHARHRHGAVPAASTQGASPCASSTIAILIETHTRTAWSPCSRHCSSWAA